MLKPALGLLICARCDCAQPVGAAKLREGLACYLYGALRFPGAVLVIDCQLLIRLEASYRTPQGFPPKLARESVISLALGQPCERCSRRTVSFCRQGGGNRALIEFTRTLQFTTPLVDARILEGGRTFRLLRQPVSARDLRLRMPALCPECVASEGFIEAHWDLAFMVGCPIHRCEVASSCPECKHPLRWFRRGLLECSCGAELRAVGLSPITDEVVALLEIIRRKTLGLAPPGETSPRLPTAELSAIGLRALLFIIRIIGQHRLMIDAPKDCDDPKHVLLAAAKVLANFPMNFYELLREIGERLPQNQSRPGVRRQFSSICTGLFKRPPVDSPEQTDFLRIAFLDFATNHWKKGAVNARFLSRAKNNVPKRFISLAKFRERFGFGMHTALRVVAANNIPTVTVYSGKRNRTFVDMQQVHEVPAQPGRYTERSAAAMIGMSRQVLSSLRKSSHFKVNYAIGHIGYGYYEQDIKMFIRQLLALSPVEKNDAIQPDCIDLHRAMRQYRGTGEGSAGAIRALLSGELPVVGNVDGRQGATNST